MLKKNHIFINIFALFILFLLLSVNISSDKIEAGNFEASGILELQTIDLGAPWIGGQFMTDIDITIPGRHFQPNKLSLTYLTKIAGYTGRQLRGSLIYKMNENVYMGYGVGWAQIEPVNLVVGKMKTGMNIPLTSFLNIRGELIGYIPIWNMVENSRRKSIFFGANAGIGLNF